MTKTEKNIILDLDHFTSEPFNCFGIMPTYGYRQDIEKALDPVFLYGEQQIYLNLWRVDILSVDILSILAEQVSQTDMPVGCLLGVPKVIAHI